MPDTMEGRASRELQNVLQYHTQVQDSIKSLFDVTSRMDERVQLMMKKQEGLYDRVEQHIKETREISTRVSLLEARDTNGLTTEISKIKEDIHEIEMKLQKLENVSDNQETRWSKIANFAIQIAWVVLAAYVLYSLGIQAPAVP